MEKTRKKKKELAKEARAKKLKTALISKNIISRIKKSIKKQKNIIEQTQELDKLLKQTSKLEDQPNIKEKEDVKELDKTETPSYIFFSNNTRITEIIISKMSTRFISVGHYVEINDGGDTFMLALITHPKNNQFFGYLYCHGSKKTFKMQINKILSLKKILMEETQEENAKKLNVATLAVSNYVNEENQKNSFKIKKNEEKNRSVSPQRRTPTKKIRAL